MIGSVSLAAGLLGSLLGSLLVLAVYAGICAGIIALQGFLSKKDSKWLGLILPFISLGISILIISNLVVFSTMQGIHSVESIELTERTLSEMDARLEAADETSPYYLYQVERIEEMRYILTNRLEAMEHLQEHEVTQTANVSITRIIFAFLIFNIPTPILLAAYASFRSKHRKLRALEKMSIQDLS